MGKSSLARELSRNEGYKLLDLSHVIKTERLYTRFDRNRGSYVLDERRLKRRLGIISKSAEKTVIATHMVGDFLPKSLVIRALVLRLDPVILYRRLRARGWTRQKAWENAEAEIIDASLQESLNLLGRRRVSEIDTTRKSVLQVYEEARIALSKPSTVTIGKVDWLSNYDPIVLARKL